VAADAELSHRAASQTFMPPHERFITVGAVPAQGRLSSPAGGLGPQQAPTREQLDAMMPSLPWQRVGEGSVIGLT